MADCSKTEVFFAEWERMCQRFSCGNCPLEEIIEGKPCSFWAKRKPEDIIKAIQVWSDEHPIKTRQSEFLKMFPDAKINDGSLDICPKLLDIKFENCPAKEGCDACKKEYWLEGME